MTNIILSGVGGQGTVLASKVIAQCAIDNGLTAHSAETIGMAQKGGSVVSHVRIGDNIYSPLIPFNQADILIGFEPSEAVRCLKYLGKDGTVIVSSRSIIPTTATLADKSFEAADMIDYLKSKVSNLIVVDADYIREQTGSSKVLNLALLGAATNTGKLGFSKEDFEKVIDGKIAEKYREMNHKAFNLGAQFK